VSEESALTARVGRSELICVLKELNEARRYDMIMRNSSLLLSKQTSRNCRFEKREMEVERRYIYWLN
jgi:hypothetical protein